MLGKRLGAALVSSSVVWCACAGKSAHAPLESAAGASGSSASSERGGAATAVAGADATTTSHDAGASDGAVFGRPVGPAVPLGCPDSSWDRCEGGLTVTLQLDGPSLATGGPAWAEPLQVPTLTDAMVLPPAAPADPAAWDRSELPAGACVFRLHGVTPGCVGRGTLRFGDCAENTHIIPESYYERPACSEGTAPGCPSPEPDQSAQFWYAVPDQTHENVTTLVLCAGLCAAVEAYQAACLSHPPS